MGDWGGDNDADNQNRFLEEEIANNRAQVQQSVQDLQERRLNIIKSQGAPSWRSGFATLGEKNKPQTDSSGNIIVNSPPASKGEAGSFDWIGNALEQGAKKSGKSY